MEFFVEGNYILNFIELECFIRILGIVWNGESFRFFREIFRIIFFNKDFRDGCVQVFSVQRISDIFRLIEELFFVVFIIECVCSQICNDLRRSGVLKDEVVDIVVVCVYSEFLSCCI